MLKREVINVLNKALGKLVTHNYIVTTTNKDYTLNHFEVLVQDKLHYGIAYLNIAIHDDGKVNVFNGAILNLPRQFIRVVKIIEEED